MTQITAPSSHSSTGIPWWSLYRGGTVDAVKLRGHTYHGACDASHALYSCRCYSNSQYPNSSTVCKRLKYPPAPESVYMIPFSFGKPFDVRLKQASCIRRGFPGLWGSTEPRWGWGKPPKFLTEARCSSKLPRKARLNLKPFSRDGLEAKSRACPSAAVATPHPLIPDALRRNGWHSVIDTKSHLRPPVRHGGGRGPRTLRRRVLVLIVASVLALLFISLKQAPQPEWQGFVGVRGLQVSPTPWKHSHHAWVLQSPLACG